MADNDYVTKNNRKLKTAMSMPTVLRSPEAADDRQRCGRTGNDSETRTGQSLSKTTSSFQIGEQKAAERASAPNRPADDGQTDA